ncbi:MAG: serine/threonine protein kinase, partial [Acidobacteria bacterium]|nr:serine/threonine protein kinase [Acidobacteriota bacterium]
DGRWIGFVARGKLWKTSIAGDAPPVALCEIPGDGARATWQGGTILFDESRGEHREIYRIPDSGGPPVPVTTLQKREWRHSWPQFLPDGKHFLYLTAAVESLERSLVLASLDSPARTVLLWNISQARLMGKDQLAYVRDAHLLSQRFEFPKGIAAGDPVTIATDVDYFYPSALAEFDASPAGTVVYRKNTTTGRLVLVDRKGTETQVVDGNGLFYDHSISPNGKSAAVTVENRATGLMDIWIYDLTRGVRDRFTSEPAIEVCPTWAPDGRSIVYAQGAGGSFPHLARRALGSTTSENLGARGTFQFSPNISPDGQTVFYENETDIYRLIIPEKRSEPLLDSSFSEGEPNVSPDGAWLAFVSNATGTMEVYLQSLTGASERIRISAKGGGSPRWRHDSRELDYVSPEDAVISVTPGPAGRWDDATSTQLFRHPTRIQAFAVAPDAQSFLISDRAPGAVDSLFHVVIGVK